MRELKPVSPNVDRYSENSFRVSGIASHSDREDTLAITVGEGGGVNVTVFDPSLGAMGIDLLPSIDGENPEIVAEFRRFAEKLASIVEDKKSPLSKRSLEGGE